MKNQYSSIRIIWTKNGKRHSAVGEREEGDFILESKACFIGTKGAKAVGDVLSAPKGKAFIVADQQWDMVDK